MRSHWPMLASILFICAAVLLGLWQQERKACIAANDPALSCGRVNAAPVAAPEAAPAPAPTPPPPAESTPKPPVRLPTPVAPAATPLTTTPVATPNPVVASPAPIATDVRAKILAAAKLEIQNKAGAAPTDLPNGGFSFAVDGARMEVQGAPNWFVTIYNNNTQQPNVETEGFKRLYEATIAALGISTASKPIPTDAGKTYLRAGSKLGIVSLVRDLETGNSCLIRPLAPIAQPVIKPNEPDKPAPPAPPVPPPVTPKTEKGEF